MVWRKEDPTNTVTSYILELSANFRCKTLDGSRAVSQDEAPGSLFRSRDLWNCKKDLIESKKSAHSKQSRDIDGPLIMETG